MGRWDKESDVSKAFNKQLQSVIDGRIDEKDVLRLGAPPGYLVDLGISAHEPLVMSSARFSEHVDISLFEALKNLPDMLQHPLAVFSGRHSGDMRVILDVEPKKHRYASVALDTTFEHFPMRYIHEIRNAAEFKILRLIQEDRSLYLDKAPLKQMVQRVGERFEHFGLYHVSDVYDKILDFDNCRKNMMDIDDYLSQVGAGRQPFVGEEARSVYEKLSTPDLSFGNRMKETVFKDAVGYFRDAKSDGSVKWKAFDFTTGKLVTEEFNTKAAARNYALGFESAEYAHEVDTGGQHHESEYIEGTVQKADDKAARLKRLTDFLEHVLPVQGHQLDFKDGHIRVKYHTAIGVQDKWIKSLHHVNGGFVMVGEDDSAVGIEHLASGSMQKVFDHARFDFARDTIFVRITGPCSHFIKEELENLDVCTKDMSPEDKRQFFTDCLDGLSERFNKEHIYPEWVDDVREELQDLSKGIVRSEGLKR